MPQKRLNEALLKKMVAKTGKAKKYLRERISRKASRQGISSISAQLIWAKELGIGIANALHNLSPELREEVRSVGLGSPSAAPSSTSYGKRSGTRRRKAEPITAATIDALLQDAQLRTRCRDLLRARKHFDRVFREATTVLDDRLKKKTGITNMNPENLVGKALNPDPSKAILEASADKAEQEGLHSICKGIMLAFRNKAHHSLSDRFTREDALKFCGFVDTVLGVIEQAKIHVDRV
jgi:uncharacterized protein (TIGR02391 family)